MKNDYKKYAIKKHTAKKIGFSLIWTMVLIAILGSIYMVLTPPM